MPRRHYLACGLTGAVGWMVYIFGVAMLGPNVAAGEITVGTLLLTCEGTRIFDASGQETPVD